MNVKLLHPNARPPTYATDGAAGADLFASIPCGGTCTIPPGETRRIGTGIAVEIPAGYAGFVYPRSGLATKHGLVLANTVGVIDSDYRGEVIVALKNTGSTTQVVGCGDRIAQLVIQPVVCTTINVVHELSASDRGAGGFGSTGR